MKNVLITGGSGFIGRHLVQGLAKRYHIYAPTSEELDLLNPEQLRNYVQEKKIDVIIHSANTNNTRKKATASDILNGNLRMYFHLKQCSPLCERIIYFGSGAEYDRLHYVPAMKEEYLGQFVPEDPYGLSKYIMAQDCEKSDNIYELCLFGVYGRYEEWERRFVSNAICRALKGMDITLHQNVKFDYLWVDDLIEILPHFIEENLQYKRYNVCRGKSIDLYSLAELVKRELYTDASIVVAEPGWKTEYSGDNSRLMRELGTYQFADYEETIKLLCEYYRGIIDEIDGTKLI